MPSLLRAVYNGFLVGLVFLLIPTQPVEAARKDVSFRIQPTQSVSVEFASGAIVANSRMANSEVTLIWPETLEEGIGFARLIVANRGNNALNFGPADISISPLKYADFDQIAAAVKKRAASQRFWAGLEALGNSLQAADAGRRTGTYSYSGQLNPLGIGNSYNYNGTGIFQYFDQNAAMQARNLADLKNQAVAARLNQDNADDNAILARQLRLTTIHAGQALSTEIAVGRPRAMQRQKSQESFSMQIRVGLEVHNISGVFGSKGTPLNVSAATYAPTHATNTQSAPATTQPLPMADETALGLAYVYGQGVERNVGEGLRLLMKRISEGDTRAMSTLASLYYHGKQIPQDKRMSFKYYLMAAEKGEPTAQGEIGAFYATGEGVTVDFASALRWLTLSALSGYDEAQINLGIMYERGHAVKQDYFEAVRWFRLAVGQGNARAQFKLGMSYLRGLGVERNPSAAREYLTFAAQKGNEAAKECLTNCKFE